MPGPDPHGLVLEEWSDGSFTVTAEIWRYGNSKHRTSRMLSACRRIRADGWRCPWCVEPVSLYRRADARYCGEDCRRRAARSRKATSTLSD